MIKSALFAATGALALAACSGSAPEASATQEPGASTSEPAPTPDVPQPATPREEAMPPEQAPAPPVPPPPPPPPSLAAATPLSPQAEQSEKGAREVLRTWAHALENHQFGLAWEQFGHPPASRDAYTRWWQRYRTIEVDLGPGESDAAMGSLYYTAPATLTGTTEAGKPFRLQGDVVVRRVNNVDGATPRQLHWHIGTADLKEVVAR